MSWNLHQCCKDNFLKAMSKARIRLSQPLRKWATEMKCKRAAALKPSQLKRALDMHGAPTSGSSLPLAGVSVAKRRRLATSNEMTSTAASALLIQVFHLPLQTLSILCIKGCWTFTINSNWQAFLVSSISNLILFCCYVCLLLLI